MSLFRFSIFRANSKLTAGLCHAQALATTGPEGSEGRPTLALFTRGPSRLTAGPIYSCPQALSTQDRALRRYKQNTLIHDSLNKNIPTCGFRSSGWRCGFSIVSIRMAARTTSKRHYVHEATAPPKNHAGDHVAGTARQRRKTHGVASMQPRHAQYSTRRGKSAIAPSPCLKLHNYVAHDNQ